MMFANLQRTHLEDMCTPVWSISCRCFEYSPLISVTTRGLDKLNRYQLLREDSVSWID